MKTNITARISIDDIAWRRVRALAARQGRALPEVLGQLLDEASSEQSSRQPPKTEDPYEPPALLRLWLRRHPDSVVERD
jgi:hypothetical protein